MSAATADPVEASRLEYDTLVPVTVEAEIVS